MTHDKNDLIIVQEEDRTITVAPSSSVIDVVKEPWLIELEEYPMTLLASKTHTAGDTRRWTVRYKRWLDNTVGIQSINVTSSSTTCTIGTPAPLIVGSDVQFYLTGGAPNETFTVALSMVDSAGQVKNDTVAFVVVTP